MPGHAILVQLITQVDSEVNILRGERDQAKDIIDDLQAKLSVVMGALADFDAERQARTRVCALGIEGREEGVMNAWSNAWAGITAEAPGCCGCSCVARLPSPAARDVPCTPLPRLPPPAPCSQLY